MNTNQIEQALRNAPRPSPPSDLRQRLLRIALDNTPAPPNSARVQDRPRTSPLPQHNVLQWARRWWTALLPTGATLICMGLLAAQQAELNELKKAGNPPPQAASPVTEANQTTEALQPITPTSEIADAETELTRLRVLVAKLTEEVATLEQARSQLQRSGTGLAPGQDFLSPAELAALEEPKNKAMRIQCINNLKQFGLAVRTWALDNGDMTPPNVLSMSNELSTPKVLFCPADTSRQAAEGWQSFSMANCSYEYLGPSAPDTEPNRILARCPIHNNVCLFDGSVQSSVDASRIGYVNGKPYFKEPDAAQQRAITPATIPQQTPEEKAQEQFRRRYGLSGPGENQTQQ